MIISGKDEPDEPDDAWTRVLPGSVVPIPELFPFSSLSSISSFWPTTDGCRMHRRSIMDHGPGSIDSQHFSLLHLHRWILTVKTNQRLFPLPRYVRVWRP